MATTPWCLAPKTALDRLGIRVLTPDLHEVVRLLRTDAYCLMTRGKLIRKNHMVQLSEVAVDGTVS